DAALNQAKQMVEDGADIIDIGGESTRPGYTQISVEEELGRILPVIEKLKVNFDTPISVDTYKCNVADAVLNAGADMINDIWGLDYPEDPEHEMAKVCAKYDVPVCVMHNNSEKLDCVNAEEFNNIFIPQLQNRINIAREAGIRDENIILDPGVGFAKGLNENKWSILAIKNLKDLGYPVLLGISNKSIIGNISNLPVGERTEGTIALNVLGRTYGSDFFRVHDVRSNKRALEIADAIMNCTN
ncbi:MAG: dihydropteroate synthase, partial [Lachnospiraceae bacterium]|nr:dihydropteroate synthase [Lachnospiraceae bacterium]